MDLKKFRKLSKQAMAGIIVVTAFVLTILFVSLLLSLSSTREALGDKTSCYEQYRDIDRAIEICFNEGIDSPENCLSMWELKYRLFQSSICVA